MPRHNRRSAENFQGPLPPPVASLRQSPVGDGRYRADRERKHFLSAELGGEWPGKYHYLNYLGACLELVPPAASSSVVADLPEDVQTYLGRVPETVRTRLAFQVKSRFSLDSTHHEFHIGHHRYSHFKDNRHHLNWEEHWQAHPMHGALSAKNMELKLALGFDEGVHLYHSDMDAFLVMMEQTPKFSHMLNAPLHKGPHLTHASSGRRHPHYERMLRHHADLASGRDCTGRDASRLYPDFMRRYQGLRKRAPEHIERDPSTDAVFLSILIDHLEKTHLLRRELFAPLHEGGADLHADDGRVGGQNEGRFNYFLKRAQRVRADAPLEARLAADEITRRDLARDLLPVHVAYDAEGAAKVEYVIDQANAAYQAVKLADYERAVAFQLELLRGLRDMAEEDGGLNRDKVQRFIRDAEARRPEALTQLPDIIIPPQPAASRSHPRGELQEPGERARFRMHVRSPSARRRADAAYRAGNLDAYKIPEAAILPQEFFDPPSNRPSGPRG